MSYKEEITKAMQLLAEDPRVLFIGQSVVFGGAIPVQDTLEDIPLDRRIEFPVAEDLQLGVSIGLALEGFVPVCIFPRMDFLVCAFNQLVNHLDKIEEMSDGEFRPHVIIRTSVGAKTPLNPGVQHCQDHISALILLTHNIVIASLLQESQVLPTYERAIDRERPSLIIEFGEKIK